MKIHSIYFMKNKGWNIEHAKKWLDIHKFKPIKPVHIMGNELRFRILPPEMFSRFVTKKLKNDIYIVFGIE